jgi:G3E family GTPase
MKSGCICCTVRGEIADALLNLHSLRARGEVDWFDRVVIETTGLADPYPVLSTIRAHPVLRSHFSPGSVIATVDAVNGYRQLDTRMEAIRQVAAADTIVLTKTDLCQPDNAVVLAARLGAINPTARICHGADADAGALLTAEGLRPVLAPLQGHSTADAHRHHHALHGETTQNVRSFAMVIEDQVDWTAFGIWLTMLLNRHGDKIFRVKGILNVAGEDRPVAVHGVQRLVHPPVHMSAWPDDARQSRLVFIMEGLEPEAIRTSFNVFNALSGPTSRGAQSSITHPKPAAQATAY